jgi:hypothetical protein
MRDRALSQAVQHFHVESALKLWRIGQLFIFEWDVLGSSDLQTLLGIPCISSRYNYTSNNMVIFALILYSVIKKTYLFSVKFKGICMTVMEENTAQAK